MTRATRIIVIGKANLMRDGLWAQLDVQPGLEVVAVLDSDAEQIQNAPFGPPPDLALCYVTLLTPWEIGGIVAIGRRWPGVRILALTCRFDDRFYEVATELAIGGYLLESDSHGELLTAIHIVSRGEHYFSASTSRQPRDTPNTLTEREKQAMRLIATG